jgi:hypothetical protein
MQSLSRRATQCRLLRRRPRRGDGAAIRRVRGGQQQVAAQAVPHQEIRIRSQCRADELHRVGMVSQIMIYRTIKLLDRLRAVGAERQAAAVGVHPEPP